MVDTIIKGTGNSRSIRSVPNLAALAPTYEKLLELLTGDGLPVDIGGLNPTGVEVQGTDLTKANLLTDETAALYGKGGAATPDEILAAIRLLITEAKNVVKVITGSYVGAGKEQTIEIGFYPKLFCCTGLVKASQYSNEGALAIGTGDLVVVSRRTGSSSTSTSTAGSISGSKVIISNGLVDSGFVYNYIAIG